MGSRPEIVSPHPPPAPRAPLPPQLPLTEVNSYTTISPLVGLLKERTGSFILVSQAGVLRVAVPQQAFVEGRQAGRQKEAPGLQAHLGGRHILKGDVAIG